jgi:hypothetical protein
MNLIKNNNLLNVIIVALFVFSLPAKAQTVSGKIIDSSGEPVAFANVMLLDADSAFVGGAVSDDGGAFQVASVAQAAILKISYVGYRDKFLEARAGDMGTVTLDEDAVAIGEVTVKGNLPKTRIKGDALVTNVAGTLLEKAGTSLDVLARTPGVTVTAEDIKVLSRGAPVVYINGREVRDPSELTQLTSDNIQSVEVIRNPGARYAQSVKAVIRIKTKKAAGDGFGFSDRAFLNYNNKWSGSEQLDVNYRSGGLDLAGMLAYSDQNSWRKYNAEQNTWLDHYWVQKMDGAQEYTTKRFTTNLSANYTDGKNHSMGANYRFRRTPKDGVTMDLLTDIYRDNNIFESSHSDIDATTAISRHEGNVYYNGKVLNLGIDFNASFLQSGENALSTTMEEITDMADPARPVSSRGVHSDADTKNTFHAAKLIFTQEEEWGTLSYGGEYTHTDRKSVYVNREGIVANDNSKIREGLAAVFAEYEKGIGNLTLSAGLRYEKVDLDYFTDGEWDDPRSKSYSDLFPSVTLTLPVGNVQSQLSYTSDITRPGYDMLRNRVDYANRYTYESGNPFLLPSVTNTLALNLSYKFMQLYADFQNKRNAFIQTSETYSDETPEIALIKQINAKPYNAVTVMVAAAPEIGKWSPQVSVSMYKQWYEVETPGVSTGMTALDRPGFTFGWKNALQLPYELLLNVDMDYNGEISQENMTMKPALMTNASLYRAFLNRNLTFLLQANDLLNTYENRILQYSGHLRTINMNGKSSLRNISLTVQYKFNTTRSKYRGTGAGEAQKNRF